MSTQQDVITAIENLRTKTNALFNAVNVPISSLMAYATQAATSAAVAVAAATGTSVPTGPTGTVPTVENNPSTIPTTQSVAQEGGIVVLNAPAIVKFGSPTSGKMYQKLLGAGSYLCGKEFFGDPIFGEQKYCYIKQAGEAASAPAPIIDTNQIDGSPGGSTAGFTEGTGTTPSPAPAPTPSVSTFVAGQGGSFTLTTATAIKFGNSNGYYQKTLVPGTYTCQNDFFGDPPGAVGQNKSCYLVGTDAASPPQSPDRRGTAEDTGSTGTTYKIKGLVVEGDSISTVTNGNPNPWPAQFGTLTGLPVLNYAVSSTTLLQMKDNYGATDHAGTHFNANSYNCMIVGSAGTNDLTQNNVTVATLQDNIRTLAGKGKTSGYIVYVTTITKRLADAYGWNSTLEARRVEYNTWLKANYATFCDGVIDFDSLLTLSDMYDGLHPSDAAALKMANAVKTFVTNSAGSGTGTGATGFNPEVLVGEGDSITEAFGTDAGGLLGKWKALSGSSAQLINVARSGAQCREVDIDYAESGDDNGAGTVYVPGKVNALVFMIGTNDIASNNTTLQTLINHYTSICSKARATGYKVWISTILRRGDADWNSSKETIRTGINSWVRSNWASIADGMVDYESIEPTTANMADGIHPTDNGYNLMAAILKAAFNGSTTSAPAPSPAPAPAPAASSSITTNGVIDNTKYVAMANNMSTDTGIAYRYGDVAPTGQNLPTWYQPSDKLWPSGSFHSGWWQLGSYADYSGTFVGGDFASNCVHVPFVADNPSERIGISALQSTSTSHGTFSQKPELPWVYYGGGLDAAETLWWKTTQGKTVQKPTCSANALGRPGWAVTTITCFQNGFIATAGYNTMTNKASCQLAAGKVPTSIALTSANELALVTIWDTINLRGEVAVISLCGLGHDATLANPYSGQPDGWWGEWNEPHPGLHNLGNLVFMKVLGYFPLPGMMAPTEISCTTGHSRFGYLDGSPGEPSCGNQNFSNETLRQAWIPNNSLSNRYAKQGLALVISKSEKKAIFLDLKPLFTYMNSMYFGSRSQYLETTNIGQNSGQWPYTFTERPQQMPVAVKTITLDSEPTCVFMYPYAKQEAWRQALIGTIDGKIRIYNVGGVNDTGNANAMVEVGSINVGANPTSVSWIKEKSRGTQTNIVSEHTRQFIVNVRGERSIKWFDLTSTTGGVIRRTFQDSRIIDPIKVVDTDNHGGEHYVSTIADYSGKKVHNVRWGKVILWTYAGQVFDMGQNGGAEFEYGGSFVMPGKPFNVTTANVS